MDFKILLYIIFKKQNGFLTHISDVVSSLEES